MQSDTLPFVILNTVKISHLFSGVNVVLGFALFEKQIRAACFSRGEQIHLQLLDLLSEIRL
jgi:hypothetical protein